MVQSHWLDEERPDGGRQFRRIRQPRVRDGCHQRRRGAAASQLSRLVCFGEPSLCFLFFFPMVYCTVPEHITAYRLFSCVVLCHAVSPRVVCITQGLPADKDVLWQYVPRALLTMFEGKGHCGILRSLLKNLLLLLQFIILLQFIDNFAALTKTCNNGKICDILCTAVISCTIVC